MHQEYDCFKDGSKPVDSQGKNQATYNRETKLGLAQILQGHTHCQNTAGPQPHDPQEKESGSVLTARSHPCHPSSRKTLQDKHPTTEHGGSLNVLKCKSKTSTNAGAKDTERTTDVTGQDTAESGHASDACLTLNAGKMGPRFKENEEITRRKHWFTLFKTPSETSLSN